MGRKALMYGAGLIALYLVVVHATGAGTLVKDTTAGGGGLVKAFEGR